MSKKETKKEEIESKEEEEETQEVENEKDNQEEDNQEEKKETNQVEDTQDNKEENKENNENNKPSSKKQNKQIILAVSLMLIIFLIMFLVPFIKLNYVDKFTYYDLEFKKIKSGNLVTYDTNIPVIDFQGKVLAFNWNFRNDPRKLEHISINIENKSIIFQKDKETYLSLEKDAPSCEDNVLAVFTLLNFLDTFGDLDMVGAVSDKDFANESNRSYITCENTPDNTVILMKSGEENIINKINQNCYELQYKECDINQVTEKFMFVVIEKYMEVFDKDFKPSIQWNEPKDDQ